MDSLDLNKLAIRGLESQKKSEKTFKSECDQPLRVYPEATIFLGCEKGAGMARKVFFSFHYDRDVHRVVQVRDSWVVRASGDAPPFYDKAEFESVKKRAGGIENWIEEQLRGTSVTVVLFGAETYDRPWVRHEIKRSYELKKGILAIDIHNVKHPQLGGDVQGKNPLSYWEITQAGRKVPFSSLYRTYDWVRDDGYNNIAAWIEAAATAAGR